jgi:hypothetical protein
MAEIVLEKDETKKMIEEKLFKITGDNLAVHIEFQSKEDYFANHI